MSIVHLLGESKERRFRMPTVHLLGRFKERGFCMSMSTCLVSPRSADSVVLRVLTRIQIVDNPVPRFVSSCVLEL